MTTAVILMAGMGARVGADKNKMLLELNGRALYTYAIEKFKNKYCEIMLVVAKRDYEFFESLCLPYKIVIGGETRLESVCNALKEVKTDRVLIHDGARILVSDEIINRCIASDAKAYFTAINVTDTFRLDKTGKWKTLDRNHLLQVQTPQGGDTKLFLDAALKAVKKGEFTDDISMLKKVKDFEVIEGSARNVKITTRDDFLLAEFYLKGGAL